MTTANDFQVGGTHYKTTFQHWDLAAKLDMGYFEGQITKYVTRHRFKKGKEDAEKALHFARKMHELAKLGRGPRHRQIDVPTMTAYAEANRLIPLEYACIMSVCSWQTIFDLPGMEEKLERLIRECYPPEEGGPTEAYVDQARDN